MQFHITMQRAFHSRVHGTGAAICFPCLRYPQEVVAVDSLCPSPFRCQDEPPFWSRPHSRELAERTKCYSLMSPDRFTTLLHLLRHVRFFALSSSSTHAPSSRHPAPRQWYYSTALAPRLRYRLISTPSDFLATHTTQRFSQHSSPRALTLYAFLKAY